MGRQEQLQEIAAAEDLLHARIEDRPRCMEAIRAFLGQLVRKVAAGHVHNTQTELFRRPRDELSQTVVLAPIQP